MLVLTEQSLRLFALAPVRAWQRSPAPGHPPVLAGQPSLARPAQPSPVCTGARVSDRRVQASASIEQGNPWISPALATSSNWPRRVAARANRAAGGTGDWRPDRNHDANERRVRVDTTVRRCLRSVSSGESDTGHATRCRIRARWAELAARKCVGQSVQFLVGLAGCR